MKLRNVLMFLVLLVAFVAMIITGLHVASTLASIVFRHLFYALVVCFFIMIVLIGRWVWRR